MQDKVTAIVCAYDGTLCPINRVGSDTKGKNEIPGELAQVLSQVAYKIPIFMLSAKDYQFLYFRVPFAKIFSCMGGIETLMVMTTPAESTPANTEQQSRRIDSRHLLVDEKLLVGISNALDQLAEDVASNFPSISIERKFTVDRILSGITFDWRHLEKWEQYKIAVNDYVTKLVHSEPYSHHLKELCVHSHQSHPSVDVYSVETNKGIGFDCIKSEIYRYSEEWPLRILYLGDSEDDNDAFKQADISIGIVSDDRVADTPLSCNYLMDFDELASFLQRLRRNNFIFSDSIL